MKRLCTVLALATFGAVSYAQRSLVVVDVETRMPIRGVSVLSSVHRTDTTDWQGLVTVPDTCRSLSFTHVKYESRLLNVSEVKDTVFLISKLMGLPEVTVLGHGNGEDKLKELKRLIRVEKTEMELAAADPSRGFDFLGFFKSLLKKKRDRRKEKFQEMLEKY